MIAKYSPLSVLLLFLFLLHPAKVIDESSRTWSSFSRCIAWLTIPCNAMCFKNASWKDQGPSSCCCDYWPPWCTAGLDVLCGHTKNNLPRDREGYDGFEYMDEKLSMRRIQWFKVKFYIFFFLESYSLKRDEKWPKIPRTVGCASSL